MALKVNINGHSFVNFTVAIETLRTIRRIYENSAEFL